MDQQFALRLSARWEQSSLQKRVAHIGVGGVTVTDCTHSWTRWSPQCQRWVSSLVKRQTLLHDCGSDPTVSTVSTVPFPGTVEAIGRKRSTFDT